MGGFGTPNLRFGVAEAALAAGATQIFFGFKHGFGAQKNTQSALLLPLFLSSFFLFFWVGGRIYGKCGRGVESRLDVGGEL